MLRQAGLGLGYRPDISLTSDSRQATVHMAKGPVRDEIKFLTRRRGINEGAIGINWS